MLCLSRKKNEKVIIGDGLGTVTVIDIQGDKVRLGFEFPKDIPIHREEVQRAIDAGARKQDDQSNRPSPDIDNSNQES